MVTTPRWQFFFFSWGFLESQQVSYFMFPVQYVRWCKSRAYTYLVLIQLVFMKIDMLKIPLRLEERNKMNRILLVRIHFGSWRRFGMRAAMTSSSSINTWCRSVWSRRNSKPESWKDGIIIARKPAGSKMARIQKWSHVRISSFSWCCPPSLSIYILSCLSIYL